MSGGLKAVGDCLLLAGDIAPVAWLHKYADFWDWCAKNFVLTVFVPGNHDYYGRWRSFDRMRKPISIDIRPNVLCRSNEVVRFQNIDVLCSTLWTHVPPEDEAAVEIGMADYRYIKFEDSLTRTADCTYLTVSQTNLLHAASKSFLSRALAASTADHRLVLTHHVPSLTLTPPAYQGSTLQRAFFVDLDEWIRARPIDAWIYGHSHASDEARIGQTKLLANQLGYLHLNQGRNFVADKVLEI